jgi:phage-related protein
MATGPWRLVSYETAAGRCPVREYLTALDREERLKVADCLDLLEDFGVALGPPHVRSVGERLWELRITGRVQHRVLYFATAGRAFVLLHAFTKKTPKMPPGDLATAKRRMADYLRRTG